MSRLTFLLHRSGYMVPTVSTVEATGEDFRAVLEGAQTPPGEAYIWCLGAEQGWTITAVCELAMNSLGIDAAAMRAGLVSLSPLVQDVEGMLRTLAATGTASCMVTPFSSKTKMFSGTTQRPAGDEEPFAVHFKGQQVVIPAVGAPLLMLRMRREQEQAGTLGFRSSDVPQTRALHSSTDDADSVDNADGSEESFDLADVKHTNNSTSCPTTPRNAGARAALSRSHHFEGNIEMCPVMGPADQARRHQWASSRPPKPAAESSDGELCSDLLAMVQEDEDSMVTPPARHSGQESSPRSSLEASRYYWYYCILHYRGHCGPCFRSYCGSTA